jgi:hypothetical protein
MLLLAQANGQNVVIFGLIKLQLVAVIGSKLKLEKVTI